MELSGVRNSWLMPARNAVLERLDDTAAMRASSSAVCACCCSVRSCRNTAHARCPSSASGVTATSAGNDCRPNNLIRVVKRCSLPSPVNVMDPNSSTDIRSESAAIRSESTTPCNVPAGKPNMRAAAGLALMIRPPPSTANTLAKTVSMIARLRSDSMLTIASDRCSCWRTSSHERRSSSAAICSALRVVVITTASATAFAHTTTMPSVSHASRRNIGPRGNCAR